MDANEVRRTPVNMTCPNCYAEITTRTEGKSGVLAFIAAGCLCIFSLGICFWTRLIYIPCFWIPFCLEDFDEITHFCPNCNANLGKVKPDIL